MTITQPQPQQGGTEKHASMRRKIGPIQRSDDPLTEKSIEAVPVCAQGPCYLRSLSPTLSKAGNG